MKNVRLAGVLMVACSVAVVGIFASSADAQKTKGKKRPALTKQLMKGLVAVNCGDLKKALDEKEVNWETVGIKAAVLNEAGYFLMDDDRCPDGDWANATKAVREATASILEASEKKDLAAANNAFKKLTGEGCGACHKAHKK